MEMTTRRLATLTLGAVALLVVARPPRPTGVPYNLRREERASDRAVAAERAARDTLRAVNQAILLRQVRDSVAHVLAATPVRTQDQLIADPRIPASLRQRMQQMYSTSRQKLGRAAALPLIVAVDSMTNFGLVSTIWVDDTLAKTPVCATVVRVHVRRELREDPRELSRWIIRRLGANFPQPRQFGLCSFEATFGPPSLTMRRWLSERSYNAIASGYDPALSPARASRYGEAVGYDPTWIPWWSDGGENGSRSVAVRACILGRIEQCRGALDAPPANRYSLGLDVVASDWSYTSYWWAWRGSAFLMNALAQSLGSQRFSELWQADAPPFDTYRKLTGVTADTLARRLLVGENLPPRLGTAPSLSEALAALLVTVLLAGLAMLSHPRRRH